MISGWPKIFTVGDAPVVHIFEDEVEVTEKIDGSQFNFGFVQDRFWLRSKGAVVDPDNPPNLFRPVVEHVLAIKDCLPPNVTFHGETLQKPKHNTLKYSRVPAGHLMLYGVIHEGNPCRYDVISNWAAILDMEVVPLLYQGRVDSYEQFQEFIKESSLGGTEMEGVVIKNYHKPCTLLGREAPLLQAKYVTERFKEKHKLNPEFFTNKGVVASLVESYCTEARWEKAIQRMREEGTLTESVKDIGPLVGAISKDLHEEEAEAIKNILFKHFWKQISQGAIRGFPQWYKDRLAANSWGGDE